MSLHLVTGGCGFVGLAIVNELRARGERVRVVDVRESPHLPNGAELFRGSILDRAFLKEALHDVTAVHHCAALVPVTRAGDGFMQVNCEGTRTLFEESKAANVRHFVHMSSSAVFSSASMRAKPLDETAETSPFEPYGVSKKAAEDYLIPFTKQNYGLSCAILRPRTVLGPGRLGILELIYELIKSGAPVYLLGPGDSAFQLVDVRDLAKASAQAAQTGARGIFHIGAGQYGTLREAMEHLCEYAATGSRPLSLPIAPAQVILKGLDRLGLSPLSSWHYLSSHRSWAFDIGKAQTELQWTPQFSNDQMLQESYDWYVKNGRPQGESSVHLSGIKWGFLSVLKLGRFF